MRLSLGSLAATGVLIGCTSSVPDYPLLKDPCMLLDGGWCPPSGIGGNGTTSSTATAMGTGGGVASSDLTGTVHRIVSPNFADTGMAFSGAATISVYPAVGSQIDVPYGGSAGSTFDAKGVGAGEAWLFVKDQTVGTAGVWSTVSSVSVPQITPVALPVVDQALITTLAGSLPTVKARGVSTSAAHVVFLIQHAGAPYQGVMVTAGAGGATIVYDTAPGAYSDTATATGAAGTAILFDAGLSGMVSVTLTDPAQGKSWPVSVLAGAGAITLAPEDLE
jgi:hypothetical protein